MRLIVETDLGRDPDDFFALCYFLQAGINIDLVCVQPGDPDQIGFAKAFLKACGCNCLVAASKKNRNKSSLSGPHAKFANKMGWVCEEKPDGDGLDLIRNIYQDETEFFVCGPCTSVGRFVASQPVSTLTMQGGYISYETLNNSGVFPSAIASKFVGKETVPSFNPGGDKSAMISLLSADIKQRRFVSKNICHTILYDIKTHEFVLKRPPKDVIDDLFRSFMGMFLENQTCKAFHDPTAAVCHVHPEIATWVKGNLYNHKGEWGFNVCSDGVSEIAGDVDRDKLWEYVRSPLGDWHEGI